MKLPKLLSVFGVGIAIALAGCIDSKYDLADIDTTTRVSVNSLVIPINIDHIDLESIIDTNDDADGIRIVDNEYAYIKSGDFSTGNISVGQVKLNATSWQTTLGIDVNLPSVSVPSFSVNIPQRLSACQFEAKNIDDNICGLNKVTGNMQVDVNISITGVEAIAKSYTFNGFKFNVPRGLKIKSVEGAKYDAATSTITIEGEITSNKYTVKCTADAFELPNGAFNADDHSLTLEGEVGMVGGSLTVSAQPEANLSSIKKLELKLSYNFGQMTVNSIDGDIKYTMDDINIPEINISNLPDVLNQNGTSLILKNPCLYLSANNPLYVCGVYARTGFNITSYINSVAKVYTINDKYFTIDAKETDNYCISPVMPSKPDPEYPNCKHVPFTELSNVLYGERIPEKLEVDLVDLGLPQQHINGFLLGHDYGCVHGTYKFVAPLQFDHGSVITYSDVVDGWYSDDLAKLNITQLEISMKITTDIPVALDFTGHAINRAGNKIQGTDIEGANVNANAQNQELKITIKGDIKDLDGIEFVAKAIAAADGQPLSPDMHITLTDIRPCVSGYYETEL